METLAPKEIQKIVRSVVVSLADSDEIYQNFIEQQNTPPAILRFYLGIKGQHANKRYTLLGGKLNASENWTEGIQREINEEAGIEPLGVPKQTIIGQWRYSSEKSSEREVMLTYNPILPSKKAIIGDPKITEIKALRLEELKQLINEGQFDGIPIEGHLALKESALDHIVIFDVDAQSKNASLSKALAWMDHIEDHLRKRIAALIIQDGKIISQEAFATEYQKLLSGFMRKGIEVAVKNKTAECNGEMKNELIKALDGGYLGKDILYYMPQLAKYGIAWAGLENATKEVQTFVNFLKGTYNEFLANNNLSVQYYQDLMQGKETTLETKMSVISALDQFFRKRLKEIFGINDHDLDAVHGYVQNLFRDLSNEMRVADPSLTKGLYQDFTLLNEVNNANFGYLLSLYLGFDSKINTNEADTLIRLEAGRQLTLLLKGLVGIKPYQSELNKVRNGKLQIAVNNFFGPIISERVIQLDSNNSMRVKIRQRGDKQFIVDEKPIKSFTSFLRKSFDDRIKDIADFHSISIIFLDENHDVAKADLLIHEFQEFLHKQFPNSQQDMRGRRTYGTQEFISAADKHTLVDGKRRGSQGSKLVRTKLIFQLDDEKLELVVYPLYSIPDNDNTYWGWLEKIKDDKDYVVRRLLAGQNGFPSTYDLLFPPDFYPHHYQHKLGSIYHI